MDVTKAAVGYTVLGSALHGDTMAIAGILIGTYDQELREMVLVNYQKFVDNTKQTVDDFNADHEVSLLKERFRFMVQNAINREARLEEERVEAEYKRQHNEILKSLKESNKPHPLGTVDQLAKRFNVSKSEIRRRKADGTLADLMLNKVA